MLRGFRLGLSQSSALRAAVCWVVLALVACGSKREAKDQPEPAASTTTSAAADAAAPTLTGCPACEAGPCSAADAAVCHRLADDYAHGRGVPFDLSKHAHYVDIACERGMGEACSALALLFQDGRAGLPHDDAKAAALHEKACELGAGIGCFNLAMMYEAGGVGVADPAMATPWYERAVERYSQQCNANDYQWCMNLGVMYENGYGVPADPARAIALYEKSCKGFGDGCVNLALMTMDGEGTARDPAKAIDMLQKACDSGTVLACGSLGQVHIQGREVPMDPAAAFPLLTRACDAYIGFACGLLSILYRHGQGAPSDFGRAIELQDLACSLGNSLNCLGMADDLLAVRTAASDAKAREMFEKGCNIGDGQQCTRLGAMLSLGKGGSIDADRALALFTEGCRRGDLSACGQLASDGHPLPILPARAKATYAALCEGGVIAACARNE